MNEADRPTRVSLAPESADAETLQPATVRTPRRLTLSFETYAAWIRGQVANQFIYDTVGFD